MWIPQFFRIFCYSKAHTTKQCGKHIKLACFLLFFPFFLSSFLLFLSSQVIGWIVWIFKYFEYIGFLGKFWPKKSMTQYIAIHHPLAFTTLHAILVQMRALLSQLIWIHFSNELMSYYAKIKAYYIFCTSLVC